MRGEFLDLGGARIYYYAAGTRGAGVPVVFLHGFPTSSHLWGDVVPLMPRGHRLVVIDLLGYGRSDRPMSHAVDIAAHAERTVALFDELRIERACVVGHGIGGGIAQTVAVRHAVRVSHLCLIDSVALDDRPIVGGRLARGILPVVRFFPAKLLLALIHRDLSRGYNERARAEHSIDLYLRPFGDAAGREALVAHISAIANDEVAEVAREVAAISCPTSVIWGQHDRLTPPSIGRGLQAAIPGATLDVIAGARHFTPEESPRKIADAIASLLERT
ncbi:MAG TPA: alpha/beta fold hydrolase [Gemmatimonadaceae bacterium]|nr:alpha/beta fold hydrolase [Gemmatimonadaceae bacterium]